MVPMTIECLMRGQLAFMRDRGFEIFVMSAPGEALERVVQRDNVKALALPLVRRFDPFADFRSLFLLMKEFRRIKPSIVQASTGKAGPLGMLAALLAGVPVRIYLVRGVLMSRGTGLFRFVLQMVEWVACRCAHRVLAVSDSVAHMLTNEVLCPPEKLKVLGKGSSNGVDATGLFNPAHVDARARCRLKKELGIQEEELVIGFVGRIVRHKGIEELAVAWQGVRSKLERVKLLMIGPLEPEDPLPPGLLEALQKDKRVVILDQVAHEDMPLYYSLIDVIAFPTYSEGLPNVPLEAAAMEVPTVGTRVTGCVDAIQDGVTGLLVPVRNATALEEALLAYLRDPTLRRRHGRAARERVLRDFSPTALWQALYQEYVALLSEKGLPLPVPEDNQPHRDFRDKRS